MVVAQQSEGDKGRDGITDHGQAKPTEQAGGQGRQLEGELRDLRPAPFAASAQRRHLEDRHGEGPVRAVGREHCAHQTVWIQRAQFFPQPGACAHLHLGLRGDVGRGGGQGRPHEKGGAQVRRAFR